MGADKIKTKKWIVVLSILILIAIVVTLVIVFLPKNISNVIKQTNTQVETMYLKQSEDVKAFETFKSKITSSASVKEEIGQDVENVSNTFSAINNTLKFYNNYLVFAQDNSTFQNAYGKIMKSYNSANQKQKAMQDVVDKVNSKLDNDDDFFFEGAWREFKESFVPYFNSYVKAFKALSEVYEKCVPTGIITNEFTILVLDNVNNYFEVISNNFDKSQDKIQKLNGFLGYINIDENDVLQNYNFSENLQKSYKTITADFGKIYEGKTFKDVIKSITEEGFTFEKSESDLDNILEGVEKFLTGGLEA